MQSWEQQQQLVQQRGALQRDCSQESAWEQPPQLQPVLSEGAAPQGGEVTAAGEPIRTGGFLFFSLF